MVDLDDGSACELDLEPESGLLLAGPNPRFYLGSPVSLAHRGALETLRIRQGERILRRHGKYQPLGHASDQHVSDVSQACGVEVCLVELQVF